MPKLFEVVPYSIEELKRLFAEKAHALPHLVDEKRHSTYFKGYFETLKAKTIVIENSYIDGDFLDDYAAYYVRCFKDYHRRCTRLHFFSAPFTAGDFTDILERSGSAARKQKKLQRSYLGFIVVKPLPQTLIGRTCLRTYPEEKGRSFPITRPYDANLFGIPLNVTSLAFQEQDTVAAACATSALWSVFQGTGMLFQHHIPSPVEITKIANAGLPRESRSLPSKGLTAMQMAHAIRGVGLEPFLIRATNEYTLKSTIYGYLRGRVPLLLVIDLHDTTQKDETYLGKHAIALNGYCLSSPNSKPNKSGFLLRASRIEKIYAHDDQVGPFARMEFDGANFSIIESGKPRPADSLSTSWGGTKMNTQRFRAVPEVILVPLYHKIRIPFEVVHDMVVHFDAHIEPFRKAGKLPLKERLEWDIYLTTSNDLKREVLQSGPLKGAQARKLVTEPLPRFLWRAAAKSGDIAVFDLLFDATDIEQGQFFIRAIEYDLNFSEVFQIITKIPGLQALFHTEREAPIFNWFSKRK